MKDLPTAIKDIIAKELRMKADEIEDSKTLHELGADSISVVAIVVVIEKELGISIPDEQISGDKDVSKFIAEIKEIKRQTQ